MQQFTFFVIITLLLSACGGNRDSRESQDASSLKGTSRDTNQTEPVQAASREKYLTLGKEIATRTQEELLRVVQGAMAEGGPAYAVDFCNLEALEIKDSLSELNNCTIQRLSFKYRNPADKPVSEIEKQQLKSFEALHREGKTLTPQVYFVGDRVEYYQPIFVGSGACLVCHGDPQTRIAGETLSTINALYPDDLATGYSLNDFRGAWKITFPD